MLLTSHISKDFNTMFTPEKRKLGHGSDRAARYFQILTLLYERRDNAAVSQKSDMTSVEIAHAIGCAPSQHVRNILADMLYRGWLLKRVENRKNGIDVIHYSCAWEVEYSADWQAAFLAWYETMQLPLINAQEGA